MLEEKSAENRAKNQVSEEEASSTQLSKMEDDRISDDLVILEEKCVENGTKYQVSEEEASSTQLSKMEEDRISDDLFTLEEKCAENGTKYQVSEKAASSTQLSKMEEDRISDKYLSDKNILPQKLKSRNPKLTFSGAINIGTSNNSQFSNEKIFRKMQTFSKNELSTLPLTNPKPNDMYVYHYQLNSIFNKD